MNSRDRAAEMGRELAQAVAVPDARHHDPLAVINRGDKAIEPRSRRPHHRPRELGIPRHAREPLDDEDIVAGNMRMPRRRRLLERFDH